MTKPTNNIAISVENLSKRYRIGIKEESPDTLVGAAASLVTRPIKNFRRLRSLAKFGNQGGRTDDILWALDEVSFDLRQGEILGLVGPNGAGKTTLLKILTQITEPTGGKAYLTGRVSSLLEVGTGFHPELSGRDNVYLNGTLLGMKKSDLDNKFDEIVDFAEVNKFIDTPVKRYSSGMAVRLAFSVAAHLEPEILLVDEVLAVGDASFQQKCIGKMQEVGNMGRTIIFVSHNMSAISSLCSRAMWINEGKIILDGEPDEVIDKYLSSSSIQKTKYPVAKSVDGELIIEKVVVTDYKGNEKSEFKTWDSIAIEIHYNASTPINRPYFWVAILGRGGGLLNANMLLDGTTIEKLDGKGKIRCTFERVPLLPQQQYVVRIGARASNPMNQLVRWIDVANFSIRGSAKSAGLKGEAADRFIGITNTVMSPYTWDTPDGKKVAVNITPTIPTKGSLS
tara:strand:- start:53791 stop:55149 length:1359 start_codon:yes stop_codon:yes gene_type:complete